MLKQKEELGAAILSAFEMNGIRQADAARHFGVTTAAINGWVKTGRISKQNFEDLKSWLTKTPLSHWGIDESIDVLKLTKNEVELLAEFSKIKNNEIQREVIGYVRGVAAAKSEPNPSKKSRRNTSTSPSHKKAA